MFYVYRIFCTLWNQSSHVPHLWQRRCLQQAASPSSYVGWWRLTILRCGWEEVPLLECMLISRVNVAFGGGGPLRFPWQSPRKGSNTRWTYNERVHPRKLTAGTLNMMVCNSYFQVPVVGFWGFSGSIDCISKHPSFVGGGPISI